MYGRPLFFIQGNKKTIFADFIQRMSITKFVIGNWFQVTHRLGIFSAILKFRLLKTLEACVISLVCWILSEENLFEFSLIHASCLLYDVVHGFLSSHSLCMQNACSCGACMS